MLGSQHLVFPLLRGSALALLPLAAALSLPSPARAETAETPETPRIEIVQPREGVPIFDRVSVAFRLEGVADPDVRSASVLLDGSPVAEIGEPPWIATIDAGMELTPRKLTVSVLLADGRRIAATRHAPALVVGDQVDIRLVNLSVSVTDETGRPLHGISREDFRIEDGGHPVLIERWSEQPEALAVSLVIDASVSMRGDRFDLAREAALAFVGRLEERDRLGLLVFNDEVLHELPIGAPPQQVAATLGTIRPHGGTALYDAIYRASDQLVASPPGMRRVMVVVSDGRDAARVDWKQASVRGLGEALRHAHARNVIIYTLGLGRNLEFERSIEGDLTTAEVLESFARSTGGRLELLEEALDLDRAFSEVIAELRHHYTMAFRPSEKASRGRRGDAEGWRRLDVRVSVDGAVVRTRQGYFSRE